MLKLVALVIHARDPRFLSGSTMCEGEPRSTTDLPNIELVNDSLKKFDGALENLPMTLENEPENVLLEGRHLRQQEKSTSTQNAFALFHSDQTHRKEPKSHLKLKAMVTDVLQDQQQSVLAALKESSARSSHSEKRR